MQHYTIKTILFTGFALLAFAGNSILCRLALGEQSIDAGSFTLIRLLSGIVMLFSIVQLSAPASHSQSKGSWQAAAMLFLYAISFSYAYLSLDTGTGALILFGAVQITMILASLFMGYRLHYAEWVGMGLAFSGFVYLVLPNVTTPSFLGFVLMALAGVAWGFYTLKGRGSRSPLHDTAYNFLRTLPFLLPLLIWVVGWQAHLSTQGVLLAITSGAVTSGVGYAIWYAALGGLTATQAAVLQLLVPVISAVGGVIFSGEAISQRLVIASVLVLGGILTVILGRAWYKSS